MTATTSTRARTLLLIAITLASQTEALRSTGRGRRLVGGAIAGIVIGCIVAVIVALILLWLCCRLFRRRRSGRVAVAPAPGPQPAFAAPPPHAGHADYAAPPGPPPATYQQGQQQQPFVGGFRPAGGKTTV
ncbi:unnamed protein product [Peniophora sp. CBMAI 1063]|nr:unnamed protein product [Peniophora sp. CBMAI 1063]